MNKIALIAFVSALSTTAAFSADLIIPTAAPSIYTDAGFDWSGFYAGANLGYGWAEAEFPGGSFDDFEGLLGGIQAGYNYDFGGFVLGVEGDIQLADVNYEVSVGGDSLEAGLDSFGTVRARAGFAIDRFMPYVTGGLAVGHTSIEANVGGVSAEIDDTTVGYTIGGGVEAAVSDNVTIKAEYLYADFGNADFGFGADVDVTAHIIRAGINYKF